MISAGKAIHVKSSNACRIVVSMDLVSMENVCVTWVGAEISANLRHAHMNATTMDVVNSESVSVIAAIKESIVMKGMSYMAN